MILITDPQIVPGEVALINELFGEGLETLHLRKPGFGKEAMAELLLGIDERFHDRIMIHSQYELLDTCSLKGLHFTGQTRSQLPNFEQVKCKKSMSLHQLEELDIVPVAVDYVFLSPLFSSVSKPGYSVQWNFHELRSRLEQEWHFGIVALGGITLENVDIIRQLGFDDYALLGSIWQPFKAGASVNNVKNIFKRFRDE